MSFVISFVYCILCWTKVFFKLFWFVNESKNKVQIKPAGNDFIHLGAKLSWVTGVDNIEQWTVKQKNSMIDAMEKTPLHMINTVNIVIAHILKKVARKL